MMFEEEEPGKPRTWYRTVGTIIAVCLLNLLIFIGLRILLEEDRFGSPKYVSGEERAYILQFLTFFSLTFCFGCWFCFCCGGSCCSKCGFTSWWTAYMGHSAGNAKPQGNRVADINSSPRRKVGLSQSTDSTESINDAHLPHNLPTIVVHDMDAISEEEVASNESTESSRSSSQGSCKRKMSIAVSRGDRDQERTPRGSITKISSNLWPGVWLKPQNVLRTGDERKKSQQTTGSIKELQSSPTLTRYIDFAGRKRSMPAISGVDFLQIPVQHLCPQPIVMVDKACLEQVPINRAEWRAQTERDVEAGKGGSFTEINLSE